MTTVMERELDEDWDEGEAMHSSLGRWLLYLLGLLAGAVLLWIGFALVGPAANASAAPARPQQTASVQQQAYVPPWAPPPRYRWVPCGDRLCRTDAGVGPSPTVTPKTQFKTRPKAKKSKKRFRA